MQIQEAKEIAKAFIENYNKNNSLPQEYLYVLKEEAQDFITHWYFYFNFERKDSAPLGTLDMLGGAPGYAICKLTGEVAIISWGALSRMKENIKRFKALNDILQSSENQTFNLKEIKNLTGLSPEFLVKLRDKYKHVSMIDEQNRITIINEIEDAMLKL